MFRRGRCHKLRKLKTPICSHLPLECALSTSARVGARKQCNATLLAVSKHVLMILIARWLHVKSSFEMWHDPRKTVMTPSVLE